jgi:signal peptide peptidase SppA
MKRQLLIAEFLSTPWAMLPERLAAVEGVLARWQRGDAADEDVLAAVEHDRQARDAKRAANTRAGGDGIAVLPLYGILTQRSMGDGMSGSGGTSTQAFSQSLRAALANDSVGQILIDINSPGGSVYGVGELAAEVLQARTQKPVVAIANSLAASAAYWVGSAATALYVTPGGEVGSIGVYQAHQDNSAALEQKGIKTTLISAGKFKVEGHPYAPLAAEALAFMQSRVDDYYQAFAKGVAKGRSVGIDQVRSGMGQGRVLGPDAALAQNMVDGVMTFDDVVRLMQRDVKAKPGASRLARAQRDIAILS